MFHRHMPDMQSEYPMLNSIISFLAHVQRSRRHRSSRARIWNLKNVIPERIPKRCLRTTGIDDAFPKSAANYRLGRTGRCDDRWEGEAADHNHSVIGQCVCETMPGLFKNFRRTAAKWPRPMPRPPSLRYVVKNDRTESNLYNNVSS